jgi:hypothetical protein
MLCSLLLMSSLAIAGPRTEVGAGKNFGIGIEVGFPNSFTGKYFFGDNAGVAFHVGGSMVGVGGYTDARVQYEGRVLEFGDWKFADLGGYWNAGVATRYWLVSGWTQSLQLGPTGGVGAEMRFKDVPAAVYAETDARLYLVGPDTGTYVGVRQFGFTSTVGGRWYF